MLSMERKQIIVLPDFQVVKASWAIVPQEGEKAANTTSIIVFSHLISS